METLKLIVRIIHLYIQLTNTLTGATHERVNKYSLVFGAESKEEVQHNTRLSKKPLAPVNEKLLESTVEEFMLDSLELGMPKRGRYLFVGRNVGVFI